LLDIIAEPSNKVTALYPPSFLRKTNQNYRTGTSSVHILEKPLSPLFVGLRFKHHDPFLKTFNEKTSRLFEAGLTDRWMYGFKPIPPKEEVGPQVLTMDHIGIGFLVCIVPLLFATVIFAFEICSKFIKNAWLSILKSVVEKILVRSLYVRK